MKIYRYRPLSTAEICKREFDALENAYLYAPLFNQLNDTMEGRYQLDPIENAALDVILKSRGGSVSMVNDQIKSMIDAFGVISLSKAHPEDQRNMWAHYANDAKGFCVEFNKKYLDIGSLWGMNFVDVQYSDQPQPPMRIANALKGELAPVVTILSTKTTDWSTERESRYLTGGHGKHHYIDDAVESIYLGHKIESEHRAEILRIFKNRKVSILQGRVDNGPIVFDLIQSPCTEPEIIGADNIDYRSYIYDETEIRNFLKVPYKKFDALCQELATSPNILGDWSIGVSNNANELYLHVSYKLRNGAQRIIPRFFDRTLTQSAQ